MSSPRSIQKIFLAREQSEGAGARIRRSIGTAQMPELSPFLMLDHFKSTSLAGFPDHPHRGQETITYVINGSVSHEDFMGNSGTIRTGGLQFMTAGRGIMHSEIPRPNPDGSPNIGLQLWVDLPQSLKNSEPRYRDLQKEEIPTIDLGEGKVHVKVISGESHGVESVKELAYTPVWLLDVEIKPGGKITQKVPVGWNAFAYMLDGEVTFGGSGGEGSKVGKQYQNVIFGQEGDVVEAEVAADAKENGRFVLVAGQPLDQTVVRYGPFVMNTEEEIDQAMRDFRSYSNGFERARGWESEIGKGTF
ncbi:RmlC-like cupin domain-containing protein [Cadophora sp. MPI-SDFR-AT-0126]|nr:RmlC-like cupin domain-containing protein [Leotiomycetes sp. MPI-SDFR-AT-0126]